MPHFFIENTTDYLEIAFVSSDLNEFDIDGEAIVCTLYDTDQETKNMIWKKFDTIFYKQGVTDPDYYVLMFTSTSGRYYCDLKTKSFKI